MKQPPQTIQRHSREDFGTRPKTGRLVSLLLCAYIIGKPFYFFPSGTPQIADFIVSILFLVSFFGRQQLRGHTGSLFFACVAFVAYSFLINAFWAGFLNDVSMLITPIFYLFNIMIVYIILNEYEKASSKFFTVLSFGIVSSVVCQAVLSVGLLGIGEGRETIFFNNPNQLGYWTLLSGVIFAILMTNLRWSIWYQIVVFLIMFYLVSISLSKAAAISYLILLAIHFSKQRVHFLLAIGAGAAFFILISDAMFFENLVGRLESIGEQEDDDLVARGYYRLWTYPEHLLFGAGEFGLSRFPNVANEFHSTIGTVLFSYGLIGLTLFSNIIWKVYRHGGVGLLLYLAPVFAYGVTHQGLRFSLFWILFAVVVVIGIDRKMAREKERLREARESRPVGGPKPVRASGSALAPAEPVGAGRKHGRLARKRSSMGPRAGTPGPREV